MDPHELLPEGLLNETDPRHTCPRCREVARSIDPKVRPGLVVTLACPNGHRWPVSYLDMLGVLAALHEPEGALP